MFRAEKLFSIFSSQRQTTTLTTTINADLEEVVTGPTEDSPLVELTPASTVSKPVATQNPHQRKPFLIDELDDCIQILEKALKEEREKVLRNYVFDIRLILALLSVAGVATLAATRPLYSAAMRAKEDKQDYQAKVASTATALTGSLQSFCAGINTTICDSLTLYKDTIMNWWSPTYTYSTYIPVGRRVWERSCFDGACSEWIAKQPVDYDSCNLFYTKTIVKYYVTETLPDIRDGDYCASFWSNPSYSHFSQCNSILANLCELTTSIGLLLANSTSPDQSHYSSIFSQEQQLSQFLAQSNYADARAYQTDWPSIFGIGGAVVTSIASAALLCCYMFCCRACMFYKDSLNEIDVYRCIKDPLVLNRLINLASRYDLPLTVSAPQDETARGLKVTTLIGFLKERKQEAKLRLFNRILYSGWLKQQFAEKHPIESPMPELVAQIIQDEDSGMSPIKQAPRATR